VLLLGAVIALTTSSIGGEKLGEVAATSVQSRQEILATSFTAIRHFVPFGSGLGSFREVYQLYEDPGSIGAIYVVHAHNDYVELLLEMGVAGALLLGIFLVWWGVAVRRVWISADAGPFAKAASIASAAILAHSLVDFPLRTAAISAVLGVCVALLADRRPAQATDSGDLRPTRHFVVR
jgi:O-antigen ligase